MVGESGQGRWRLSLGGILTSGNNITLFSVKVCKLPDLGGIPPRSVRPRLAGPPPAAGADLVMRTRCTGVEDPRGVGHPYSDDDTSDEEDVFESPDTFVQVKERRCTTVRSSRGRSHTTTPQRRPAGDVEAPIFHERKLKTSKLVPKPKAPKPPAIATHKKAGSNVTGSTKVRSEKRAGTPLTSNKLKQPRRPNSAPPASHSSR